MKIETKKLETLKSMLYMFAGGSIPKNFSQEATNRTIFVTNLMKALSDIEINDEIAESINTLLDLIISYDVSLFDLYEFCGTNAITLDGLTIFFAHYRDFFNTKKSSMLQKIYLSITSDSVANNENSAVLDIIHKINKLYVVNNSHRITPIIKFSYVLPASNDYFVNDLSAINAFYTNQNIETAALADKTFIVTELKTLYDELVASYNDREYYLYRYNQLGSSSNLISFIMNFNTSTTTGAANVFYNNVYVEDVPGLLRRLTEELYVLYMRDIVSYTNRNKVFKPGDYYKQLKVPSVPELTKDNYKYAFFKAMIVRGKSAIITTYCSEIEKMQNYIKGVQAAALADKRFVLGE